MDELKYRGGVAKGFTSLKPKVERLPESEIKDIFRELIRMDLESRKEPYGIDAGVRRITKVSNTNFTNINTNFTNINTKIRTLKAEMPQPGDTVVTEQTYGQNDTAGILTKYSREDHSHGTTQLSDVIPLQDRIGLGLAGTGLEPAREDHQHPEILHELRLFNEDYDTYPPLNDGIGRVVADGKWSFLENGLATPTTEGSMVSFRSTEQWTASAQGSAMDVTVTPNGSIVGQIVATFTAGGLNITGDITGDNLSGTNTGDQDLSGYVPYTGTIGNVFLGEYALTARTLVLDNTTNSYLANFIAPDIAASNKTITIPNYTGSLLLDQQIIPASANAGTNPYNISLDVSLVYVTVTEATINLPASAPENKTYIIRQNPGSGSTLVPPAGETINGGAAYNTFNQYDSVIVIKNGTDWAVISKFDATAYQPLNFGLTS